MKLFDGCLLACDIDGTLLINGRIPPRNIEMIRYFTAEGGKFSLSTGRTVGAVGTVLDLLDNISPSVVANGCMIYDYKNHQSLFELTLPVEDYRIAQEVYELGGNIGIEIHCGERVMVLRRNNETDDHERYEGIVGETADFDTACRYSWNKVLYVSPDPAEMQAVRQLVSVKKNSSCFMDTTATLYNRPRHYYEQIPQGVSKATALKKLCNLLHIKNGCYYAIGDYYNDLEMIRDADIGAVPDGSPDDIRRQADYITGSVADGAVADFIDYLAKIRKGCI